MEFSVLPKNITRKISKLELEKTCANLVQYDPMKRKEYIY